MTPEAATLVAFMRDLHGWWTAAEISNLYLMRKGVRLSDRKIRALVAASKGEIVSGPGGKGYKHRTACTEAEIQHAAASYKSQAKRMNERAAAILRG